MVKQPHEVKIGLGHRVAQDFTAFAQAHNLNVTVDPLALSEGELGIYETFSSGHPISRALLQSVAPRLGKTILYHYTSYATFKEMIKSGELQLNSLVNQIGTQEYLDFATSHGLAGVNQIDANGQPIIRTLTEPLYFTSFAMPNKHDDAELWKVFARNGHGVRLEMIVEPKATILREILYGVSTTLLKDLNDILIQKYSKPFVPLGVSTLAAFFLPSSFSFEGEARLLMQDYPGADMNFSKDGKLPIPIGQHNLFCDLTLMSVTCGKKMIASQRSDLTALSQNKSWTVIP